MQEPINVVPLCDNSAFSFFEESKKFNVCSDNELQQSMPILSLIKLKLAIII